MKKLRIVLLCLLTAIFIGALAACGGGKKKYTLTFDTNGGSEIRQYQLAEGAKIPHPADPTRPLSTFEGWYADDMLTEPFDFSQKMPAHDLTVYANWNTQRSTRIEYNSMGGSEVEPSIGAVGSRLTAPSEPVYDGYLFGGWYTEPECINVYAFTVFPNENITLYARWINNPEYVYVDFFGNGTMLARVPIQKGTAIEEPDFFDDSIISTGWYTNETLTSPYTFGPATAHLSLYTSYYTEGLVVESGVVTGYNGAWDTVVVPNILNGNIVIAIDAQAFAEQDIYSVVLPETVKSIGRQAFYRCRYLDNINLSSKVTELGAYAFFGCQRLTAYGDISSVTAIPEGLFLGCLKLPAVTLSQNLRQIGTQAFADCASLKEIVIPNSVTALNDYLFDGCALLEKVTLPANLASFGVGVFAGCGKLAEISIDSSNTTFLVRDGNLYRNNELLFYTCGTTAETDFQVPDSVTRIAAYAFDSNSTLKSIIVRSENVEIVCGAFANMKALESLTVPVLGGTNRYLAYYFGATAPQTSGGHSLYIPETLKSVTLTGSIAEIKDNAFYGAVGLEEINGIVTASSVGAYAFAYTALKSFNIPASLTSIGEFAFEGCTSFMEYTVAASSTTYAAYDGALYNSELTRLINVPAAKATIKLADSLKVIASYAFTSSFIEEVVVPDSVETIEFNAFNGAPRLNRLTVPFLGDGSAANEYLAYIFGCTVTVTASNGSSSISVSDSNKAPRALKEVTVGKVMNEIPTRAFALLPGLEKVNFAEGSVITSYGAYSFIASGIIEWDFTGVTNIGDYAFSQTSLVNLSLPATLETAGEGCFSMNDALESIELAEGITEIPEMMFYCYAYSVSETSSPFGFAAVSAFTGELVIPSTVEKIGDNAFFGFALNSDNTGYNLSTGASIRFATDANGDTKLKTIGEYAFAYSGLLHIEIPASVQTISAMAFVNSMYLESVTVGSAEKLSELTQIGYYGFAGCSSLKNFTLYTDTVVELQFSSDGNNVFYLSNEAQFYVPANMVDSYKADANWVAYAARIQEIPADAEGGNS